MVLPQTDLILKRWSEQLGGAALTVVAILGLVGVFVAGSYLGLKSGTLQASLFSNPLDNIASNLEAQPHYCDGTALVAQATQNFLDGENPYETANVITALEQYDKEFYTQTPYTNVTPLQEGIFAGVFPYPSPEQLDALWQQARVTPEDVPVEIETNLCYPAGSFLLLSPFVAMGIGNLQIIVLLFFLAAFAVGLWLVPGKGKVLFAIAMVVSLELWITGIIGLDKRLIVLPFVLAGWLLLNKRPFVAAALLGIAAATYQTTWFMVPFVVLYVLHQRGIRTAVAGAGIIGLVFLGMNLPFIAMDPMLWVKSVLSPMIDPLYPMGIGLVSLVQAGIVGAVSSTLFLILEIAAFTAALAWYWRFGRQHPAAALPLSVLPIFFSWRSLESYFYYVDIILLAMVWIQYYSKDRRSLTTHER